LGRKADNDFPFPGDRAVSRQHAEIVFENDTFYLQEQYSIKGGKRIGPKYGTFLNGQRVHGRLPLSDGDTIQLGPRLRLRFHGPDRLASEDFTGLFSHDDATGDHTM